MVQSKFGASLSVFVSEITNQSIITSLEGLKRILRKKSLTVLKWDEKNIAIAVDIPIELPPLGNFENIDIRRIEPILIIINLERYPGLAPSVYTDRLDFPKDSLAHLYVAKNGKPPALCLERGDFDEWYSNKQLTDLVTRVQNWFRDAATGQLKTNNDQFDPVRLEGYNGTIIYDYDQLALIVKNNTSFSPGSEYAIGLFERTGKDVISFKLVKIITAENLDDSYEEFKKEKDKESSLTSKKFYHFGYIVWTAQDVVIDKYHVEFPDNWQRLNQFAAEFGISLERLETQIVKFDLNTYIAIPVLIAVKRSKKLIGFSENIEFFNFCVLVNTPDVSEGKIINNVDVFFQSHKQPLSLQKAKKISGSIDGWEKYSLIVGCGALGSKIIMHLSRAGITNLMLADPDEVSPHNLVRHALFASSEGLKKATALKNEIDKIFPLEKSATLAFDIHGKLLLSPVITNSIGWILDFTASNNFLQVLVKANLTNNAKTSRGLISDFGDLGILFIEGKNRNPRMDDLQILLYDKARETPFLSAWLKRESEMTETNLSVTVGVGCNSETIVLADDIVSMHAAYFSGIIKAEANASESDDGMIYLNRIIKEPYFASATYRFLFKPLFVANAVNDSSWQIRMKNGLIEEIKAQMNLKMPHETGGVFIGSANYKTKTIHVVDIIHAPPDSRSNPICFFRGIDGLPRAINKVNDLTGNQLGYIGEWHSHPLGPNEMSATDLKTVKRFKSEFESLVTPLPVFLMIITSTHVLPFVF